MLSNDHRRENLKENHNFKYVLSKQEILKVNELNIQHEDTEIKTKNAEKK